MKHKEQLQKNIADYKQSVIDKVIQKRKNQQDFGRYWRMQMDMN